MSAAAAALAAIISMRSSIAAQHTYECGVHDADGSDDVNYLGGGRYRIDFRNGKSPTYGPHDMAGLDAPTFALIDYCSMGGVADSPLNLATISDSGKLTKFGLSLHVYRVVAGSDGTRSITTVRMDAEHRPIEVMVRDQHGSHTLEY
ncbi:MAG: hypothetical protein M3R30_09815, partial [Candidatus Eremiobacteraeota bacterium]|nr:hypothetical protein [Candidatus Eremiobacteraeota bacterium]